MRDFLLPRVVEFLHHYVAGSGQCNEPANERARREAMSRTAAKTIMPIIACEAASGDLSRGGGRRGVSRQSAEEGRQDHRPAHDAVVGRPDVQGPRSVRLRDLVLPDRRRAQAARGGEDRLINELRRENSRAGARGTRKAGSCRREKDVRSPGISY